MRAELVPLDDRLKTVEEHLKAMDEQLSLDSEGTLCTLRNQLLQSYNQAARKGYRTHYESESFRKTYNIYTAMHGNTFIQDDIETWFKEIPYKSDSKYEINKEG